MIRRRCRSGRFRSIGATPTRPRRKLRHFSAQPRTLRLLIISSGANIKPGSVYYCTKLASGAVAAFVRIAICFPMARKASMLSRAPGIDVSPTFNTPNESKTKTSNSSSKFAKAVRVYRFARKSSPQGADGELTHSAQRPIARSHA